MIPKKIFTVWVDEDGKMPEIVRACIETQKLKGYTHEVITLDDLPRDIPYVEQCLNSPYKKERWCKLSDYIRVWKLYHEGGIYLDADVEVLPDKNFDGLLHNQAFVGRHQSGFADTAVQAAQKHNPFYKEWLEFLDNNHRGDDDKIAETSYLYLTEQAKNSNLVSVYSREVFYPYGRKDRTIEITPDSITLHYYMGTWSR